jgi:uncharacterized caspase-like protein
MWMFCIIALSCISTPPAYLLRLRRAMILAGECIWIADDIADIIEDRDNRQWSFVSLALFTGHASRTSQKNLSLLSDADVMKAILERRVICDSIAAIRERLSAVSISLRQICRDPFPYEHNLLMWLNSWICFSGPALQVSSMEGVSRMTRRS